MREKRRQELGVAEGFIIIILQKGGAFQYPGLNPQIMSRPTALGWYEGMLSATLGVFPDEPASVLE